MMSRRPRGAAPLLLLLAALIVVLGRAAPPPPLAPAPAPPADELGPAGGEPSQQTAPHPLSYYDEDGLAASLEATGGLAGRGTGDLFTFVGAAASAVAAAAAAAGGGGSGIAGAAAPLSSSSSPSPPPPSDVASAAAKAAASKASAALQIAALTPAKVLWPWADGAILRTRLKMLNATLPASLKPALRAYFDGLPGKMCGAASAAAAALAPLEKEDGVVGPPPLPKLVPDLVSDNLCPYKVMQMPLNGIVGPSTWGVVAMEWAGESFSCGFFHFSVARRCPLPLSVFFFEQGAAAALSFQF